MNKKRKGILALGTVASIVAPIAAVVSCGGGSGSGLGGSGWGGSGYEGRFDQENDGVIKIMHTWTKGGKQERALQDEVDVYNALSTTKMKVELERFSGGYKSITPSLTTKFEAGDKKTLPNLIFGYGDTLGSIVKYDMQLDMETSKGNKDLRNSFEEKFIKENDNIGGLDGSKGTYIVPASKSTDVENINSPVLGFLFAAAEKAGANIAAVKQNFPMPTPKKLTALEAKWGKLSDVKAKHPTAMSNITIDNTFFIDYSKQLSIATKIQKLMSNATKNGELHVLGADSMANIIYMMAYAKLGAKDLSQNDSFLFNKGSDGYIKHDFMKSGKEKEAFKYVYSLLKPAITSGALYINTGGAYASGLQVHDQIALAIGSTAGYSHNFITLGKPIFSLNGKMLKGSTYKILSPAPTKAGTNAGTDIIGREDNYYKTPIRITKQKNAKYDIIIDSPNVAAVKAALQSPGKYVITSDPIAKTTTGAISVTQKGTKYLLPIGANKNEVGIISADSSKILEEKNLTIKNHPYKIGGAGTKFAFAQGPSIIGLHSNHSEDEETRKFMHWLTHKNNKTPSSSPLENFAKEANYISPTKGSFNGTKAVARKNGFNKSTAVAYNWFEEANGSGKIFTNPIDDTTSEMRAAIERAINKSYIQVQSGGSSLTIEDIYQVINAGFNG